MRLRKMTGKSPFIAILLGIAVATPLLAQGTMTRREAPPMPPVDANKCVIDGPYLAGSGPSSFRIKNRAEKSAKDSWRKWVARKYGPAFAKWDNASRSQGRDVNCWQTGNKWHCQAKATPCMK